VLHVDADAAAQAAAIAYLKSYRRWFGHWSPVDPRPTAHV
jgi:hypothetical protein